MEQIKIFNSDEFGSVRTIIIDGEPWFAGKDVAASLGYKDTSDALKKHVAEEDKLTRCFTDSGQNRQMYVINESGLYSLIFGSKLESAQKFKHGCRSLDKAKPIIVLEHQPKQLEELERAGADMQLCGHTHDGQMFPGNLTVKLMWENACGYLKKGNLHSIVTSGVGVWGPAMRVGTDCEICPITIHFQG